MPAKVKMILKMQRICAEQQASRGSTIDGRFTIAQDAAFALPAGDFIRAHENAPA
jgi:hypothetical protein